jgi:hypothetical protein
MKLKYIILSAMTVVALSSCEDWLDVNPKSQIKEEDQFSREGGYKDELTGVYTAMSSKSMYGLNMGIGFTEVLSHSYDVDANGSWRYANDFDYTNSNVESVISSIWSSTYNCIANLNLVIKNIDQADSTKFSDNTYYTYRGEAYGLRAFLHFDLMRLFACAPAMDKSANGVPYVTEYSTNVVAQKPVSETMQQIINDLLTARQSLSHDSLKIGYAPYTQRAMRIPYFNYYACDLTLARAYLWMGDTENALKYANEVIAANDSDKLSTPFRWVDHTSMESSNMNEIDFSYSSEHVFHLTVKDWEDIGNYYFTSKGGTDALSPSESTAKDIYEFDKGYGNDYRYLKGYEQDGDKRYMCKFWHIEGSTFNDIYPLIRMSEAYYIAAECMKTTNPKRAIALLNEVRKARNLSLFPLSNDLTADQIQNEIYKEYRKEFTGECGQLFFYYKRLNSSSISGSSVRPGKSVYVLPIPTNDKDFGGYTN